MGDAPGREDWGTYLRRITDRPGWSVARLARESGLSRATIFGWIQDGAGETVKVGSILAIAAAAGEDPLDALRAAAGLGQHEPEDAEIRAVLDMHLTPVAEKAFIDKIMDRREQDRQRRLQDTQNTAEIVRLAEGQGSG